MRKLYLVCLCIACSFALQAQTPNQIIPYGYQYYQKFNTSVYDTSSKFHSSIKGFYSDDSLLVNRYRFLNNLGADTANKRKWVIRKLFDEHLIHIEKPDYTFYADFLPDLQIGREFKEGKTTWLNTRGYQIGITVGKKFSFYTNGFENQGVFTKYLNDYIDSNRVVPGQNRGKFEKRTKDWTYPSAILSYTANKYINFALGYDKNFIGDGYNSLFLSDVAPNYSFFRIRALLGSVQYQTIFAYMIDQGAPRLTADTADRRLPDRGKWNAIHYLDWNVSKRVSLGFFQAITWSDIEPEGKRGFDFNYIHPFIFLRPIEGIQTYSPDKVRLGINGKYEILHNTVLYTQFMLDEYVGKEFFAGRGFWANKYAWQLGVRGSNLFGVEQLNYLAEYNMARPFTYSHLQRLTSYSASGQPLAHPLGANFRELTTLLNYSYKRLDFQVHAMIANYGLDQDGKNYGKNILLNYYTRATEFDNRLGQGLNTDLFYYEAKASYMINPKYGLRIELGTTYRNETNREFTSKTNLINIGLRSTFRNFYQNF